jgi:deoxyribodipyrimidine photo-lyase
MVVDTRRIRHLNERAATSGPVVYWMSRDQRVDDNWALLYAHEKAQERGVSLCVIFALFKIDARGNTRQYRFMFEGLKEVETTLATLQIPFFVLSGPPDDTIPAFVKEHGCGEVVVDFNPLEYARTRRDAVAAALPVRLSEVDAHNIIPCWHASEKEEFAAYTFRPKVHRALATFLTPFPVLKPQTKLWHGAFPTHKWEKYIETLSLDVVTDTHFQSGEGAAKKQLATFIQSRLDSYHHDRNDPTKKGISDLSPYLHFGQISAQRVALTVQQAVDHDREARDAFIEELVVRRELADNYCFYNKNHSRMAGAHAWAQKTIKEHVHDVREYIYTKEQFETASTHDDLWNAMQLQMVEEGKMHGWCRMYWAKKILEWTPDVETAISTALYLNDKYELDGNDPNGVVGVMWSICGVHDRAWNERPIFGKIRYMNYAGAKRKFDIKAYIERYGRKEGLFA